MEPLPLDDLSAGVCRNLRVVLTDIDGTMTDPEGRIPSSSFAALEHARQSGLKAVVVTGRPAGWCDMIARTWPVDGVVGENGGLAFRREGERMERAFEVDEATRAANRTRLDAVAADALAEVAGCGIASDQPYRELDLAVDFAEDVGPLSDERVRDIVGVFERHGATAKVSNIHVNGWYGDYDKLGMALRMARRWWDLDLRGERERCLFLGDSPNDEPMFAHFPHTIGVANVRRYLSRMRSLPRYVTSSEGSAGFAEALEQVTMARGSRSW